MIRATLIATALGVALVAAASASPLDREAGAPHVAMDMGVEPLIEIPTACDRRGPWFCTETQALRARIVVTIPPVICDGKACPEEIFYGPGPAQPASAFAYLGLGRADRGAGGRTALDSLRSGAWLWSGGTRAGDYREGDRLVTIYEKHVVINKWHKPTPIAPVPLPSAAVMLLMALLPGYGWYALARRLRRSKDDI